MEEHKTLFVDYSKCIGCETCDLCKKRRARDMVPACVEMCPCNALKYVERSDIEALKSDSSEEAFKRVMAHIRPKKFID